MSSLPARCTLYAPIPRSGTRTCPAAADQTANGTVAYLSLPIGHAARKLAGMVRSGAWAAAAAGGLAGLGYYLVVTGKLTIDTGWAAGSARSARSASRSPPRPPPCST